MVFRLMGKLRLSFQKSLSPIQYLATYSLGLNGSIVWANYSSGHVIVVITGWPNNGVPPSNGGSFVAILATLVFPNIVYHFILVVTHRWNNSWRVVLLVLLVPKNRKNLHLNIIEPNSQASNLWVTKLKLPTSNCNWVVSLTSNVTIKRFDKKKKKKKIQYLQLF